MRLKSVICSHEPFPIDPHYEEEEYQLTLRALVVGWALGAVVGASVRWPIMAIELV
jgi:hypothetical protein